MRVNKLAAELGVTADTVRYYTRKGFLKPIKNNSNGYKEYLTADYHRLRFILTARQLGFSVIDIGEILEEVDSGKSACPLVRQLIKQRLGEVEQRFQDMAALRRRMLLAVDEWSCKPDKEPSSHSICHLIDGFFD
jgi:DNA-binding transcriptional MerR regulator